MYFAAQAYAKAEVDVAASLPVIKEGREQAKSLFSVPHFIVFILLILIIVFIIVAVWKKTNPNKKRK